MGSACGMMRLMLSNTVGMSALSSIGSSFTSSSTRTPGSCDLKAGNQAKNMKSPLIHTLPCEADIFQDNRSTN